MAAIPELTLQPIGRVVVGRPLSDEGDAWEEADAEIEIEPQWQEALDGIDGFSHIWVIWWLDRSKAKASPDNLRVHPEGRQELPLVGLFGTRAPFRPNPIAITAVRLLTCQDNRLRVEGLDAFEGTPILDVKPYLRRGDLISEATMPDWLEELWHIHDREHVQKESLPDEELELFNKTPKRRLKVDLDALEIALDTDAYEISHYLNLETGDVIPIMEEVEGLLRSVLQKIETWDEDVDPVAFLEVQLSQQGVHDWQREMMLDAFRIEEEFGTRYIRIESDEPHDDYRAMQDFVTTVEDPALRDRLWDAIRGRGAFRRFKDLVARYSNEQERWYEFKNARSQRRLERWLENQGIEPSL
jgi:tRNA-Thr(GGU) m(6)t(6)A37 methyltransferase TsaA